MVLRGAQFQRPGPDGCAFLTRRAFSSDRAMFVRGHLIRFHVGDQCRQPHKGLASYDARR